jgi:cell division transport system permease protein
VAVPATSSGPISDADLARVITALRELPRIVRLRVVPLQELLPLLPPGAGSKDMLAALPLPRLVDISFEPGHLPDRADLIARLTTVAPNATVGEPSTGGAESAAVVRRLRLVGWAGGALALASLVAGSALVVRAALLAQRDTVSLLRSLGAGEAQVARQFEQYAARNGLYGALSGFVAALAILVVVAVAGGIWPEAGLVEPRLALADWLRLMAVPVAAALLAASAARLTVRLGLARLG